MKVSFDGGRYMRALDLKEPVVVTIKAVAMEKIRNDEPEKPTVEFEELPQKLTLNKTNGTKLIELFGDETDDWLGQVVELYPTMTDLDGDQVPCVRLRGTAAASVPKSLTKAPMPAARAPQPAIKAPRPAAKVPQPPISAPGPALSAPELDVPVDS